MARAYAGGDDQGADIGNAGGRIIRAAFLGSILKPFSLCSYFSTAPCLCVAFAQFSSIPR